MRPLSMLNCDRSCGDGGELRLVAKGQLWIASCDSHVRRLSKVYNVQMSDGVHFKASGELEELTAEASDLQSNIGRPVDMFVPRARSRQPTVYIMEGIREHLNVVGVSRHVR